jgi:hypothetical protein
MLDATVDLRTASNGANGGAELSLTAFATPGVMPSRS